MVRIAVIAKESSERYKVDILVPCEWLLSDESLANFPVPIQCTFNMKLVLKPGSLIQLSTLLCIAGIATVTPLQSGLCCFSSVIPSTSCLPSVPLVTDVLSISSEQGVKNSPVSTDELIIGDDQGACQVDQVTADDSTSANITEVAKSESDSGQLLATTSCLKPLSIELGPTSDFTFLVSHVVSPTEFYVHPIQENIAHGMSRVTESLLKHYSILSNQCHISQSTLSTKLADNSGSKVLCAVQCPDDEQWYRGVISASPQEGDTCLVQLLDFGECIRVSLGNVFELAEEFCDFPSEAVCCSLGSVESSPSALGNSGVNSSDTCAQDIDKLVCDFLRNTATSRQLVACVKLEGELFCTKKVMLLELNIELHRRQRRM